MISAPLQILCKIWKVSFLTLIFLLYLNLVGIAAGSFYDSDCLIFGPEQIVGALNCGYLDDGIFRIFYYDNQVGFMFRYFLYFVMIAVLTWLFAIFCKSWCLRSSSHVGFKKRMLHLLFASLFAVIFIGIGNGIFAFTTHRDKKLWEGVNSLHSLAEYESYFGEAKYHFPKFNEKQYSQFIQNSLMCDMEFALGKELYVFNSAWPFRRFFVWLENGQVVRMTWRGGL